MTEAKKRPVMPARDKKPAMPTEGVPEGMGPQRFDPKTLGRVMRYMKQYKGALVVVVICILLSAMERLGWEQVTVSEYGNLDGYLKRKYQLRGEICG